MKKVIACPRTFSSEALNVLLKLTSKRTPKDEKTEASCRNYISKLEQKNTQPYPVPQKEVSRPITTLEIDGMQTFKWGSTGKIEQPVILYLHGGAYMNQPYGVHFKMVDHIAKGIGAKVFFPVYPKIPRYTYKDAYPKLVELYKRICLEAKAENIIFMGDSSGAGLALGLACCLRDNGFALPHELMLFSPWLDVHTDGENLDEYLKKDPTLSPWRLRIMGELWAGSKDAMSDPLVSPLYCDPTGLPHITILTGDCDATCPDTLKFAEKLENLGIEHSLYVFEGMVHVFIAFPIAQAKPAQELVIRLLNK